MTKGGAAGRRWFWLRDLVLPASQAASETIPLYAVVTLIAANAQETLALSYALLAFIVTAAAWLTRLTGLLPATYQIGRVALGVLTAIGLVLGVHAALAPTAEWDPYTMLLVVTRPWMINPSLDGQLLFTAWFLIVCLWSRGLWIGLEAISTQQEARWFIGGMAVLLAVGAALAAGSVPESGAGSGFLRATILWYFFTGLLVLALAHASTLRGAGGPAPGASLSWLLAVAIPIVAIPLAGLFFTFGAAPALRLALQLGLALGIIGWHILLWIGYWLLLFLRWLSNLFPSGAQQPRTQPGCVQPPAWLLHFRRWLSSWFGSGGEEPAPGQLGCAQPPPPVRIPEVQDHIPISSSDATILAVVLVFGLLFALVAYLLIRHRVNVDEPGPDDERSSAWSWVLFLSQLRDLWVVLVCYWRGRLRRRQGAIGTNSAGKTTYEEADIRGLYRRFLRRAAELNHRRPSAVTPLEFARSLNKAVRGRSADIAAVSDAYDQARYGEKAISAKTLAAVREAVTRFEATGHEAAPAEPGSRRPRR
jgi:hypothetical protein